MPLQKSRPKTWAGLDSHNSATLSRISRHLISFYYSSASIYLLYFKTLYIRSFPLWHLPILALWQCTASTDSQLAFLLSHLPPKPWKQAFEEALAAAATQNTSHKAAPSGETGKLWLRFDLFWDRSVCGSCWSAKQGYSFWLGTWSCGRKGVPHRLRYQWTAWPGNTFRLESIRSRWLAHWLKNL